MPGTPSSAETSALPAGLRRNSLANVAGRTASAFVWVAVTPWALRHMGAERFGVWSLFFALSGSLVAMDFGLSSAVTRFVALAAARGEGAHLRVVLNRALRVAAAMGAVWLAAGLAAGALFCAIFHVPAALIAETTRSLAWFGLALALLSVGQVWQGALTGVQRLDLANGAWLAGLVVHVGVLCAGLAAGHGLLAAAVAACAGNAAMAALSWWHLRAHAPTTGGEAGEAPRWGELLRYGGVVQATNVLVLAQMQGGRVLLGMLGGLASVTAFELAFRVANTLWSAAVLMQGAIAPAAAACSAAGNTRELVSLFRWGLRWMNVLASVAMGGLFVAGEALLRVWLGAGAGYDAMALRGMAVAFLVATPALTAAAIARGAGRPALETQFFALAAIAQLALALLLASRQGAAGAAWALAGSFAVSAAFMLVRVSRWLQLSLASVVVRDVLPHWAPALAAAGAVAWASRAGVLPAPHGALAAFLLLSGAYAALALLLGLLPGDTQVLWHRVRRAAGHGSMPA